jgi:hypothetical protein
VDGVDGVSGSNHTKGNFEQVVFEKVRSTRTQGLLEEVKELAGSIKLSGSGQWATLQQQIFHEKRGILICWQ